MSTWASESVKITGADVIEAWKAGLLTAAEARSLFGIPTDESPESGDRS